MERDVEAAYGSTLDGLFETRGAHRMDVPIVQPAEPYLDAAGEALRRRIFLTRGEAGETLCLRPDFTIPVCRDHVLNGAGLPNRISYRGLVFRQGRDGPTEFVQAGIEDLGEPNRATADARAIGDAFAALEVCGVRPATALLGDQGLFEAVMRALGLPAGWQRRLIRTFGDDAQMKAALDALAERGAAGLEHVDPELKELARQGEVGALTRAVRSRMEEAGLPPHSGRSPLEVAERLVEKVQIAEARLAGPTLKLLEAFLRVDCPLDEAADRLQDLVGEAGLELGAALTFFRTRNLALDAAAVDLASIRYRAAFGRPIDYYTGLVFEMRAADGMVLVGGGRYDRLLTLLGASQPAPAVGFALSLDRVAASAAEAS